MTALSSYDPSAPLLLVTAFAPGNQGGGAVILRSLLKGSESSVVWASLASDSFGYEGRTAHLRFGCDPWFVPPRRLARRIAALADTHSASAIWAVAHGPLVPCLPALIAASARGLHVSVHDDPAWSDVFRRRRRWPLAPWLHAQFGRTLASATSVDVIGGGMRAAIACRAGRDSIIVHRVLDEPIAPNDVPQQVDRLTIGLLGSVYASRQLAQLTEMLSRTSEIIGLPTRLVVIGGTSHRIQRAVLATDVEVEFVGHLAEQDGLQILRSAFALYIGYPFGPRERTMRRTSFPAKLATYVQAARPLLVHTPYDSSLAPLFERQPFVIPWVGEDAHRGARLLALAWGQASLRGSHHDAAEAVRQTYFGADNRTRLFNMLDALVSSR